MIHLLVLVLDDVEKCHSVLAAWDAAGVKGVTIIESTGLERLRRQIVRDDMPLMPSLQSIWAGAEEHHRTYFTVIDDDAVLERVIQATEETVGDFNLPNTGILFVVPVSRALGLRRRTD
jgi:nitrogen regulatory protein P-II 1